MCCTSMRTWGNQPGIGALHARALRGSKALTRYALIDTWLPCLGWDTGDPAQVVPEYRVPSRQVRTAEG